MMEKFLTLKSTFSNLVCLVSEAPSLLYQCVPIFHGATELSNIVLVNFFTCKEMNIFDQVNEKR